MVGEEKKPVTGYKRRTEVVELPSGNEVELRLKIDRQRLIRKGLITQDDFELWGRIAEASAAGETPDAEEVREALAFQDVIAQEMFVNPTIYVPEGPNDETPEGMVDINEIEDEDLEFVLIRAFGGDAEEASFRDGTGDGDGSGADGSADSSEVRRETERDHRPGSERDSSSDRGSEGDASAPAR